MEQWRSIANYEGVYEVSDEGRVRSCDRLRQKKDGVTWKKRGVLLAPGPNRDGYLLVHLRDAETGKDERVFIHRLVLEAFVGPCPHGMECRHGDGLRNQNVLTNLSWATHRVNMEDQDKHGTRCRGFAHPAAKLTPEMLETILRSHLSTSELSQSMGVSKSIIARAQSGRRYAAAALNTRVSSDDLTLLG